MRTENAKAACPIVPLQPGEGSDLEIDTFLRDAQQGWYQSPALMAVFARVPEGLRGWRRLVEGIVGAVGPIAWELVAHRTAVVTGSAYETTQPDESVRNRVEALRPAVMASDFGSGDLSKSERLIVALADGVASHEVSGELFQELKGEFPPAELVALCMAASVTHVSHLVSDALELKSGLPNQRSVRKSRSR